MKCKYCGFALSNNRATCPHCGMLMTQEQLKTRKEMNGYKNPYMEVLDKLNKQKIENKLYENEQPKNVGGYLIVAIAIILVIIICILIYLSR